MSKKYKKTCTYLNYVEQLLISVSTVIGCVSISGIALLVCVPVDITSSAVGIKIWGISAESRKRRKSMKK